MATASLSKALKAADAPTSPTYLSARGSAAWIGESTHIFLKLATIHKIRALALPGRLVKYLAEDVEQLRQVLVQERSANV